MDNTGISFMLGSYEPVWADVCEKMKKDNILLRIWNRDYRVWKPSPAEIVDRLDWLTAPAESYAKLDIIRESLTPFSNGRIDDILLAGMGGSSLCVDVFSHMFGGMTGFPRMRILDTTDPEVIRDATENLSPERTLFIVSSKSGKTLEITSLFNYLYQVAGRKPGVAAKDRFLLITDAGSPVLLEAEELRMKHVFSNNPNIGGRFSALSLVGIVPAMLIGVEVEKLLQRAMAVAEREKTDAAGEHSPGSLLGAALGTLALQGRDKLTLVLPPSWKSFGDWLEQLIAESTGKEGKGILPVLNEPPLDIGIYGNDRSFVFFVKDDVHPDDRISALVAAGHPVLKIRIGDDYDLGAQMFLWEMATAIAGHVMGIHPFDQPDVEATKKHTRQRIEEYKNNKEWPRDTPSFIDGDCEVYGETVSNSVLNALTNFLESAKAQAYVALQLYTSPSPELDEAVSELRAAITRRYRLAATIGCGPRYLHSTGQLHKGDAGGGLFLQITGTNVSDLSIPDGPDTSESALTFGELKAAQAEADRQALKEKHRRVLRLHWNRNPAAGLKRLASQLQTL